MPRPRGDHAARRRSYRRRPAEGPRHGRRAVAVGRRHLAAGSQVGVRAGQLAARELHGAHGVERGLIQIRVVHADAQSGGVE